MKTLIAIPCMDMVHTSFMKSLLKLIKIGECEYGITCSSLIYDARNQLASQAVAADYDRILWLDSDMVFGPDLLVKLSADMDEGRELVSAMYFKRKPPFTPVIYKDLEYSQDKETNMLTVKLDTYHDYPLDQIFPIAGCGFGACMVSTDLINRVGNQYGHPFAPLMGLGEDLTFCYRVAQLGVEMFCDSRIKMGHVGLGTITEQTYLSTR